MATVPQYFLDFTQEWRMTEQAQDFATICLDLSSNYLLKVATFKEKAVAPNSFGEDMHPRVGS